MKKISILGSTGSIGCNTLRVVEALADQFTVAALSADTNVDLLVEQIEKFKPELVAVADEQHADKLRQALQSRNGNSRPEITWGVEGLSEVALHDGVEIVIGAVVGALGLLPTLRALESGRRVALANKETLVVAGEFMTRAAAASGAELLPVDSEHNALHQCLKGEKHDEVKRLILTASGGPFRTASKETIQNALPAQALKHPTWNMGAKITIDSATMMNKGLEVIEAHWLFDRTADEIDIIVHPQSVVHSMVELLDGSIIAQLGVTDMRHPIQYALTYPERQPSQLHRLNLASCGVLEFHEPDRERFPCINLAYHALRTGGTLPAVLNAANEVAVAAFLREEIRFGQIADLIDAACNAHTPAPASELEVVLDADRRTREWVNSRISAHSVA